MIVLLGEWVRSAYIDGGAELVERCLNLADGALDGRKVSLGKDRWDRKSGGRKERLGKKSESHLVMCVWFVWRLVHVTWTSMMATSA